MTFTDTNLIELARLSDAIESIHNIVHRIQSKSGDFPT